MNHIKSKFAAVGARLRITDNAPWLNDYALGIGHDRHGEFFHLRLAQDAQHRLHFTVLQAVPKERHLLLLVRTKGLTPQKGRFLCGHDERHWFVAAVPGLVSTVEGARNSLKPVEVLAQQERLGLKSSQAQTRRNAAFCRQGEWFFLPAPDLVVDEREVLCWEPIRRWQSKPHWVERLSRQGGTRVYVSSGCPVGVSEQKHRELILKSKVARAQDWRVMVRGAEVYAQGAVRHPDHATIHLSCWHRVLLNGEGAGFTTGRVDFLD